MQLRTITLKNFRSFRENRFEFSPALTVILGPNAQGKTNLLESIHFVVNGVGFREVREEEFIRFEADGETCVVEGNFDLNNTSTHFAITLLDHEGTVAKRFLVNQAKKRLQDYKSLGATTVLFAPHQIEIITGSPSKRREYLNRLICAYDVEYARKLRNYESAIRKRNKLLETYSSYEKLLEELEFWDKYLEEQSEYITAKRQEYIDFVNNHPTIESKLFSIEYLKSKLTVESLQQKRALELRIRRTTVGPQKDDFIIGEGITDKKAKNVHIYGSRSEQRLAILWLKLNEIFYFEEVLGKKPILLLDDVFSEFDEANKRIIMQLIRNYQTILTTTEPKISEIAQVNKRTIELPI